MLNATVVQRIDVTPELVRLFIKPDVAFKDFLPGQYVALGLTGSSPRPPHFPPDKEEYPSDKLIKRAYSIGSSPEDREALEFYVAIVPDGGLTSRLVLLNPGDRIFLAPKITGTFTIESVPAPANLVLVSTGTGIAPFMSMIRTGSTWTEGRKISIIHGVRFDRDLCYREELEDLERQGKGLSYFSVVSRSGPEWGGRKGHVQKLFEDGTIVLDPKADHVFLCGNPAMINDMEKLLLERGYTEHSKKNPGNMHLERYW